jgi:hypothetical protein
MKEDQKLPLTPSERSEITIPPPPPTEKANSDIDRALENNKINDKINGILRTIQDKIHIYMEMS